MTGLDTLESLTKVAPLPPPSNPDEAKTAKTAEQSAPWNIFRSDDRYDSSDPGSLIGTDNSLDPEQPSGSYNAAALQESFLDR